ncbi:LPO_1073/Vpar_1526 family protein [Veillonella agrestimuris]|uniref:LPO_1073/Vpar_1526 family protein n=1 Tax=Veillonella agrestimuris TaxID=2941340 RepID=UPI00203A3EA8|nr:LPO_1073/Vpar_1526 family protein [Veillonella agrestimuris]
MSGLTPYIVLAVVAIVFFIVCYALFRNSETTTNGESHITELPNDEVSNITPYVDEPTKMDTDELIVSIPNVDTSIDTSVDKELNVVEPPSEENNIIREMHEPDIEDTFALGESPAALEEENHVEAELTQMIGTDGGAKLEPQGPSLLEETRLFDANEMADAIHAATETEEEGLGPWAQATQEDNRVELAMQPFMASFGTVHSDAIAHVESITRKALAELEITKITEVQGLLQNIVVQEALLGMQKAYATTPTPWMKMTALEAFIDVAQCPKSSTHYLVAFDALLILPHLTLGHFQVMALLLLLQYSRNSNNYGRLHFQHYVAKYIEPFISNLPHDSSFYRQLDYLRCIQWEREQVTLTQLLSNSYPFVFNYRGFTKEELLHATGGAGVNPRFVVRSLNSNLYKLAVVDDSLTSKFFRQARISNPSIQRDLISLMKSKPTSFTGSEARQIMDDISPVLSDVATLYDETPMSRMSLTMLGLYLGRAHVKAVIGEEFDISYWL